ncbi:guanine nucleotide binding protein, alpha subunit [Mycena crocata]|nr:guanine nucleotide binding protein, alpha subunit [Mycena crocata]
MHRIRRHPEQLCQNLAASAAKSRSDSIDASIGAVRRDKLNSVLVLGAPESGKSSFMKQARLLSSELPDAERNAYRDAIYAAVIATIRGTLDDLPAQFRNQDLIASFFQRSTRLMDSSAQLHNIWADSEIQAALRSSLQSSLYLIGSLDRISDPSYTPTDDDIIRFKLPSPPVSDVAFSLDLNHPSAYTFRTKLTCIHRSIGLQRKWIHSFDGVEAVIFLVEASSYDQMISSSDEAEDSEPVNAIREAIRQFEAIRMHPRFSQTAMALVMNKTAALAQKLGTSPLAIHFPDYAGGNDPAAASQYLSGQFTAYSTRYGQTRSWCTNVVDINSMSGLLREIAEFILRHRSWSSNCTF